MIAFSSLDPPSASSLGRWPSAGRHFLRKSPPSSLLGSLANEMPPEQFYSFEPEGRTRGDCRQCSPPFVRCGVDAAGFIASDHRLNAWRSREETSEEDWYDPAASDCRHLAVLDLWTWLGPPGIPRYPEVHGDTLLHIHQLHTDQIPQRCFEGCPGPSERTWENSGCRAF